MVHCTKTKRHSEYEDVGNYRINNIETNFLKSYPTVTSHQNDIQKSTMAYQISKALLIYDIDRTMDLYKSLTRIIILLVYRNY